MHSAIEETVTAWKRQKLRLLPGLDPLIVRNIFTAAGYNISATVVALYSLTGGMPTIGDMDEHLFWLMPLEDVLKESKQHAKPYVVFADGFISAQLYCLKYENPERSSVYMWGNSPDGSDYYPIAASLEEALFYLRDDPARLWLL